MLEVLLEDFTASCYTVGHAARIWPVEAAYYVTVTVVCLFAKFRMVSVTSSSLVCNGSQHLRNMILVRALQTYAQSMLRHLWFVVIVLPDSKGSA